MIIAINRRVNGTIIRLNGKATNSAISQAFGHLTTASYIVGDSKNNMVADMTPDIRNDITNENANASNLRGII
jgi:hypothetical protein